MYAGSGSIDARELKAVLSSLGQEVSDEAVKKMIAEVRPQLQKFCLIPDVRTGRWRCKVHILPLQLNVHRNQTSATIWGNSTA